MSRLLLQLQRLTSLVSLHWTSCFPMPAHHMRWIQMVLSRMFCCSKLGSTVWNFNFVLPVRRSRHKDSGVHYMLHRLPAGIAWYVSTIPPCDADCVSCVVVEELYHLAIQSGVGSHILDVAVIVGLCICTNCLECLIMFVFLFCFIFKIMNSHGIRTASHFV